LDAGIAKPITQGYSTAYGGDAIVTDPGRARDVPIGGTEMVGTVLEPERRSRRGVILAAATLPAAFAVACGGSAGDAQRHPR
jgi:hypothetical protein